MLLFDVNSVKFELSITNLCGCHGFDVPDRTSCAGVPGFWWRVL